MLKLFVAVLAVAGLLLAPLLAHADSTITVYMVSPANTSVFGTATIAPEGDQLRVTIHIQGLAPGTVAAAGLYAGNCLGFAPQPLYRLNQVRNQMSDTVVSTNLTALENKPNPYYVVAVTPATDTGAMLACGDVLLPLSPKILTAPTPVAGQPATNANPATPANPVPSTLPNSGDAVLPATLLVAALALLAMGRLFYRIGGSGRR